MTIANETHEDSLKERKRNLNLWEKNLKGREELLVRGSNREFDSLFNLKLDQIIEWNKNQNGRSLKLEKTIEGDGTAGSGHSSRILLLEEKLRNIFKNMSTRTRFEIVFGTLIMAGIVKIAIFGG